MKVKEPTLKQMPLLEYTLRRWAHRLAQKLGIPTDTVDEKWDEIVDPNLTYWENKERVKEYLLSLAKHEELLGVKEYIAEIEKVEDEEIHRQLEHLIYTVRDILEGNTDSDYYLIAEASSLLEQPLKNLVQELSDWKSFLANRSYLKKYSVLINELIDYELRLGAYVAKNPQTKVKDIVGKYDEIMETLAKSKVEIEEEEVVLRPIIVKKAPKKVKPLVEEKEEKKEEEVEKVEEKEEKLTESEFIKEIEIKLNEYKKLPLKERYEKLKQLKPAIQQLLKFDTFEARALAYYYKQMIYPLIGYYGSKQDEEEFKFLRYVKPVIEYVWR